MKRQKTFIYTLLGVFVFMACNQESKKKALKPEPPSDGFYTRQEKFKPFKKAFTDSLESYFPSGFNGTVLFYRKGYLYKKAIGYRDLKKQEKMQITDAFQLASVSKTVTAVALMQLFEKKKIHLDSTLNHYLLDFPYPGVTVRHLLNHRSGLPNYMYFRDSFYTDTGKSMDNAALYTYILNKKPEVYLPPGHSFSYCNTNFALLVSLIERVSGQAFHRYVEEQIFKPAGMKSSFYYGHQPKRIKNAVLTGRMDQYVYEDMYFLDAVLGDKSLYSTVDDLFLFHLALAENRLIKPETLQLMQEPSYAYNVYGGSYGLGFRLLKTEQGVWTYHNGWWRGFWTSFWNRFDKKTCLIILTNNKQSSHINKAGLANLLLQGT